MSKVTVYTGNMPSELYRRLDYVLQNIVDNYQSYEHVFGTGHQLELREILDNLSHLHMTKKQYNLCGTAFVAYYKSDERLRMLKDWWNKGVSNQVFKELGS